MLPRFMKAARIRELLRASPFRPFELVTAARSYPVPHRDDLARIEADPLTVIHVNQRTGEVALLDLEAIEAARFRSSPPKSAAKP